MEKPPNVAALLELVELTTESQTKSHERLRLDLQAAVSTLGSLTTTVDRNYRYFEDQNAALRLRLNTIEQLAQRPIDGTTVVWTTKAIVGIFSAALVVAGALMWVRFDLQAIHDTQLTQSAAIAVQSAAITDLKIQRENDKRDAQQQLTNFLNQSLKSALDTSNAKEPKK